MKLFILNKGSLESLVKEETACIIESGLIGRNTPDRLLARMNRETRGIKRLDSITLNEMTDEQLSTNLKRLTKL